MAKENVDWVKRVTTNLSIQWFCSTCHEPFTNEHQDIHPTTPYGKYPEELITVGKYRIRKTHHNSVGIWEVFSVSGVSIRYRLLHHDGTLSADKRTSLKWFIDHVLEKLQ